MEIKEFFSIAVPILTVVGIVVKWGYDRGKNESIQEEIGRKNTEQDGKLTNLFSWKDAHNEDAASQRVKFQVEMAEIRGELKGLKESHNEQFAAIMERFTRIEDKIDRLEQRN